MEKTFLKTLFIILIFVSIVACNLKSSGSLSKNWQIEKSFKDLNGISNEKDIANIQIGFYNNKVGFAINKGNHVYYTNNSGDSWNESIVKTPPCLTGMELIDENNIVIGCRCSKVKFSNDSGINWETIDENNFTLFSFYDRTSGIIAKSDVVNIVKMIDNNNIREIILPDEFKSTAIAAVSCVSNNDAYVLLYGEGPLLKTTDGGLTWEVIKFNNLKSKLFYYFGITSMRFTDKDKGFIVTYSKKDKIWNIINTNDGGKNWTYEKLLKSELGGKSYISKDGNNITLLNIDTNDPNPVSILKRKI